MKVDVYLLDQMETSLRLGKIQSVQALLTEIDRTNIPRHCLQRIAAICRRSFRHKLALQILNPVVRPERLIRNPAQTGELTEYASSLLYIGATAEAETVFRAIREELPEVLLGRSFLHFSKWEYDLAIPWLKKYVALTTDYVKLVGKLNLAAALVNEPQIEDPVPLLEEIVEQARRGGHDLILGNAYELKSQHLILSGNPVFAVDLVAEGLQLQANAKHRYVFFLRKWKAIAHLLLHPNDPNTHQAIDLIRREAAHIQNWHTLRECDLFKAVALRDFDLFVHVSVGTPFSGYHHRMKRLLERFWPECGRVPAHYDWSIPSIKRASRQGSCWNLAEGTDFFSRGLKQGQILHRLLNLLTVDFYEPRNGGSIFSALFPNEYFCPASSIHRVYDAIARIRQWMIEQEIPFTVEEERGTYSLRALKPCRLRVSSQRDLHTTQEDSFIEKIKDHFSAPFSSSEAALYLGKSKSSTIRLLNQAVERERLIRMPFGKHTKYKLAG